MRSRFEMRDSACESCDASRQMTWRERSSVGSSLCFGTCTLSRLKPCSMKGLYRESSILGRTEEEEEKSVVIVESEKQIKDEEMLMVASLKHDW